jgi:RNA polymerase sigma factor (TIGR02999 family)
VTCFLNAARTGDREAADRLLTLIYLEMRALAGREFRGQDRSLTLRPTDLVHEAFMRLVRSGTDWENRSHFFAVASTAMLRILVDHVRARRAQKRGGGEKPLDIDELAVAFEERSGDLIKLDDALAKLAELDPIKARLVELCFFGGLTVPGAAEALGVSRASAERAWTLVRAWLQREVTRE